MSTALFKGNCKKGEMFQDNEDIWYIAIADGVYQDAADLEDGFDVFLPGSGTYTEARIATAEEIDAHFAAIAEGIEQEKIYTASFAVGQRVRRKTATEVDMTVLEIDVEKRLIRFVRDGFAQKFPRGNWDFASNFVAE